MARCSGIRADGGRCKNIAIAASEYCYNHHPDKARERQRNTSRGGRAGGRGRPSAELRRLQAKFEDLVERLEQGDIERADAAVMGQLLGGARACVRDLLAAREQEALAGEMELLREQVEEMQERKGRGGRAG